MSYQIPPRDSAGKTIVIRASSLADMFDCAYRWEARQILKMRTPASLPMILGSAVHAGTAMFDAARMSGAPIRADDAAGVVVDKLRNPGEDVERRPTDMSPREAEVIALTLHGKYCSQISPQYEFRAVELTLGAVDIYCPDQDVTVRLTGQLDRSRVARRHADDVLRITDLKTGARAAKKPKGSSTYVADTTGKGLQLGVYQILAEQTLDEPIDKVGEIVGLNTSASTAIAVSEVPGAKAQILPTGGAPSLIEIAANMMRTGLFPPNPKSMTCGPVYCPRWKTCPYHE